MAPEAAILSAADVDDPGGMMEEIEDGAVCD
jgi:hypothetical protein